MGLVVSQLMLKVAAGIDYATPTTYGGTTSAIVDCDVAAPSLVCLLVVIVVRCCCSSCRAAQSFMYARFAPSPASGVLGRKRGATEGQ